MVIVESKISIENVTKIFGSKPRSALPLMERGESKLSILKETGQTVGLWDITLSIPSQKITVIMGLSGSGKSTLVRHINRLIEPTKGRILVDGKDILAMDGKSLRDFRRFQISMIFQKFGLFPHKNIIENIGYGLNVRGVQKSQREEMSRYWLEQVGLSGFGMVRPHQLSGGMQQRVGLARALATDPEILLMDEPFGALDPLIRRDMQELLLHLQKTLRKTIVFITHDLEEALKLGHQIAMLKDGVLVQCASPGKILLEPEPTYVRQFLSGINRGKFLQVRSVMTKRTGVFPPGRKVVAPHASLESLLPLTYQDDEDDLLIGANGKLEGYLAKRRLIHILTNSAE